MTDGKVLKEINKLHTIAKSIEKDCIGGGSRSKVKDKMSKILAILASYRCGEKEDIEMYNKYGRFSQFYYDWHKKRGLL